MSTEEGGFPIVQPTSSFVREMLARSFGAIASAPTLEDRFEARSAAGALLYYVTDERTVSELLGLLRRAIDLEDLVTLTLIHDIPPVIDGRESSFASLLRLAEYAFLRGKARALEPILYAALLKRRRVEDAPMIQKEWLLAAIEGRDDSDCDVVALVEQWAAQPDADLGWFKEILRGRPALRRAVIEDFRRIAEKGDEPEGDEIPF